MRQMYQKLRKKGISARKAYKQAGALLIKNKKSLIDKNRKNTQRKLRRMEVKL